MNSRKPSHDSLRLFRLFRTGSAPGDSVCFPMRWSPSGRVVYLSCSTQRVRFSQKVSIRSSSACFCASFSRDQRRSSSCSLGDSTAVFSSSASSWDSVMPSAPQTFSSDGREGIIFLRYQEEMVDWGRPERSASWYSVQPRLSRYRVISARISFIPLCPLTCLLRLLYLERSLRFNDFYRIIFTIK